MPVRIRPKGRAFKQRYPERTRTRGSHKGYWTDSYIFKTVLMPLMNREGACVDGEEWGDEEGSGVRVLASRACDVLGITQDALARRIYDVMHETGDTIKIETAEALIIACGEIFCIEPLPTFPGTPEAALDMAEAWAEPGEDVEALAHRLIRFAIGWGSSEEIVDPKLFRKRKDARNEGVRRRRALKSAA